MKNVLLAIIIALVFLSGCTSNIQEEQVIGESDMQVKMSQALKQLSQSGQFVVFSIDDYTFIQVGFLKGESKPYELDVPLNEVIKKYENQLTSFYDSRGIEWTRNDGSDGMVFIDASFSTSEETAEISELIFKEVFGKQNFTIDISINK